MSELLPLAWRADLPERYDGLPFFVFVTAPFLLTAPEWLAILALLGLWLLTRR